MLLPCSLIGVKPSSFPPTRYSLTKSVTSSDCISIPQTVLWCSVWTRKLRFKLWTEPNLCSRCDPVKSSGAPIAISATGKHGQPDRRIGRHQDLKSPPKRREHNPAVLRY